MKKLILSKLSLLLLSTCLFHSFAQGQQPPFLPNQSNGNTPVNQAIKQALEPFFYVVCAEYVLEDKKGKQFGADGNKYFNRRYTIGVAVSGRLLVDSIGVTPWVGDTYFDEYRNNDEYKAVLYKIRIRPIHSKEYLMNEIDFNKNKAIPLSKDKEKHQLWFYPLPDSTLPSISMRNMNAEKMEQTLSVMVQVDPKCDLEQNDLCEIELNIQTWGNLQRKSKLLSFVKPLGSGSISSNTNNSNKFLGGGCIQFEASPGQINMSLVGYIQLLPNKNWGVIDFTEISLPVKPKSLTPTSPEPAGSNKKPDPNKVMPKGNTPKSEASPKSGSSSDGKKNVKNNDIQNQ